MSAKITLTIEELMTAIMEAFVKGENWGVTYSGWFSPSEEDKANRAAKDCEEVYQKILLNRL